MVYILPNILMGSSNYQMVIAKLLPSEASLRLRMEPPRVDPPPRLPPIVRIYPVLNVPTEAQFSVHHCRSVWRSRDPPSQ